MTAKHGLGFLLTVITVLVVAIKVTALITYHYSSLSRASIIFIVVIFVQTFSSNSNSSQRIVAKFQPQMYQITFIAQEVVLLLSAY